MRTVCAILLLNLLWFSCSKEKAAPVSWNKTVDSLLHDTVRIHQYAEKQRQIANTAVKDCVAVSAVIAMAEYLPVTCINTVADAAEKVCEQKQLNSLLPDVYCKQGIGFFRRQKYDTAVVLFRKSIAASRAQANKKLEAQAICWIGDYYRLTYQFDSSEAALNDAIRIAGVCGDFGLKAHARAFIGDLYRVQGNYDTALFIYNLALKDARQANDELREGFVITNIGDIFRLRNQNDSAFNYFDRAYAIAVKLNDYNRRAFVLSNKGDLYRTLGKNPEALRCFNEGLDAARKEQDKRREAYCLISMADLLNGQKKNSEALQYATNARNLALSINDKGSLGRAWQIMGETYRNRKISDSAIYCFRQAISLTTNSKNLLRLTS
ncbi:MAG: tetratricopeptide repeat protein, partial [Bacteroidia bacterium]